MYANVSSGADSISLNGSDTLFGGTGANAISITGDGNQAHLFGSADVATIIGTGADTVWSDGGSDTVNAAGSSGNDLFILGSGMSSIVGGSGDNSFELTPGFGNSTLEGGTSGANVAYFDGLKTTDVTETPLGGGVTQISFGGSTVTVQDIQTLVFTNGTQHL
jgi:hypothetical protein